MQSLPFLVDKKFCIICGLPVNMVSPRGTCMSCKDEADVAGTIATLAKKAPQNNFKDALAEVRRQGRPTTLDIAEAAMETLGGAAELGKMMATDLKKLRGDYLDKELQQFHDPDWKVIKGLYETLVRLSAERDKMVGESGDPLDGVSEDDLMSLASVAAMIRLETDADFRKQLLNAIVPLDPEAVLDAAGEAINVIESRPKVEVIDAKST